MMDCYILIGEQIPPKIDPFLKEGKSVNGNITSTKSIPIRLYFCIKKSLPLSAVLGPVVQSIISLTRSLRGQLVKCFTTLKTQNIDTFF